MLSAKNASKQAYNHLENVLFYNQQSLVWFGRLILMQISGLIPIGETEVNSKNVMSEYW